MKAHKLNLQLIRQSKETVRRAAGVVPNEIRMGGAAFDKLCKNWISLRLLRMLGQKWIAKTLMALFLGVKRVKVYRERRKNES